MKSSQPRKQRRARHNAPLHRRRREMAAPLDRGLRRKQLERGIFYPRSLPVRKGDRVLIVRGEGRHGTTGERAHRISLVDRRRRKVFVEGFTYHKADATELHRPVDPSNVVIVNPDWSDPMRRKLLQRVSKEAGRRWSDEEIAAIEATEDEYEVELTGVGPDEQEETAEEASEADADEETAPEEGAEEATAEATEETADEVAPEAEETDTTDAAAAVDYDTLTVAQLKELLRERELPLSGRKAELVARLREGGT